MDNCTPCFFPPGDDASIWALSPFSKAVLPAGNCGKAFSEACRVHGDCWMDSLWRLY